MKKALPVWDAPDGWPAGTQAYLLNKPYVPEYSEVEYPVLNWMFVVATYQEPHPIDPDVTRPVTAVYSVKGDLLGGLVSRACHELALKALGYEIVDHAEGENA